MESTSEWQKDSLLQSPIFAPLHSLIGKLTAETFPTLQDCNALLAFLQPPITVQSGLLLKFVQHEHGRLPFERQYEPRCYLLGEVPTRSDNWHDLFNTLVWLTFPKTKAAINARHFAALLQEKVPSGSQRSAVRDVNTLLDESGVIIPYADNQSGAELACLLREFKWKELFWHRRTQVQSQSLRQQMGFYILGHGLYEKALQPYVGMTGHGLLLQVESAFFGWPLALRLSYLDGLVTRHLTKPGSFRSTHDLSPVPLLGVPGWAAENDKELYYDNTTYFRSGRMSRKTA